jgi:hypothetical protein
MMNVSNVLLKLSPLRANAWCVRLKIVRVVLLPLNVLFARLELFLSPLVFVSYALSDLPQSIINARAARLKGVSIVLRWEFAMSVSMIKPLL